MGEIKRISFYSIGVFLGILHTERAKTESFKCTILPKSAFGKWLIKLGCPHQGKDEKLSQTLTNLARQRGEPEPVTENCGCKGAQDNPAIGQKKQIRFDTYCEEQFICDKALVGDGKARSVLLEKRKIGEVQWEEYMPRIVDPERAQHYGVEPHCWNSWV